MLLYAYLSAYMCVYFLKIYSYCNLNICIFTIKIKKKSSWHGRSKCFLIAHFWHSLFSHGIMFFRSEYKISFKKKLINNKNGVISLIKKQALTWNQAFFAVKREWYSRKINVNNWRFNLHIHSFFIDYNW